MTALHNGVTRDCVTRDGVTLVELLLVLALGLMVMMAASTTFTAVVGAEDRVSSAASSDRVGRVLLARIAREIESAVRSRGASAIAGKENGERDELTVRTLAYGGTAEVRYSWSADGLLRAEKSDVAISEASAIPIRQVTKIGFRFHDGVAWREGWSEVELPRGVAIELHVGDRLYEAVVAL